MKRRRKRKNDQQEVLVNFEMKEVFLRRIPQQEHWRVKYFTPFSSLHKSTYKFWSVLGKGYLDGKISEYCKTVLNSQLNLQSFSTKLVGGNNKIDANVSLNFLIFLLFNNFKCIQFSSIYSKMFKMFNDIQ